MTTDTRRVSESVAERTDAEVMAAVDGAGREERLVIADVTRDDAWLATPTRAAACLAVWR